MNAISPALAKGFADYGPVLQAEIAYAWPGKKIEVPPCRIASPVVVDKAVDLVAGRGTLIQVAGAIEAFRFTAQDARFIGGKIVGDRTPGQTAIKIEAPEVVITDTKVHLVDKGVHQTKGFHASLDGLRMRNIRDAAILIEGITVGTNIENVKYDTDCPANGGPYAEPLTGGVVLKSEGAQLSSLDFIHAGTGLLIDCPTDRDVYWHKIAGSFFDSCSGPGIHIRSAAAGRKIMGLFFDDVWSATNAKGLLVNGSEPIDGVKFDSCPLHNGLAEAAYIDNAQAKNIRFSACDFAGNSRSAPGSL